VAFLFEDRDMRITINVPDNDKQGMKLATEWADMYIGNDRSPSQSFVVTNSGRSALIERKKNGNWSVKVEPKEGDKS